MLGLTLDIGLALASIGMGSYGVYQWVRYRQNIRLVWCLAASVTLCTLFLDYTVIPSLIRDGYKEAVFYLKNITDFLCLVSWVFATYRDGFNH